jgi:hypothetical protein
LSAPSTFNNADHYTEISIELFPILFGQVDTRHKSIQVERVFAIHAFEKLGKVVEVNLLSGHGENYFSVRKNPYAIADVEVG